MSGSLAQDTGGDRGWRGPRGITTAAICARPAAGSWMGELKLHVKAVVLPAQHIGVPSRHQARMLQGAARW